MIIHWIFLVLILWTVPSTSLVCYECNCPSFNTSACDCSATTTVADGAHCTIIEDFHISNSYLELSSAFLNSSYVQVKDPYYIIVDESIFYNETTGEWATKTKRVVYGCDWDYCNPFSLISSLPDSFKLTIDSNWLDDNIYGNGSFNGCYNCPEEICGNETHSINYDLCLFSTCDNSTTCSLYDLWHDVDTNELCYQSQCTPSQTTDEDNEKYKVEIEAIVYLAQNRSHFEIWQLNINCAADNCTRSTIFQEVKEQIQGEVSNLTAFPINRPTTTAPPPTTTSTAPANPLYCYSCTCTGTVCPCTHSEVTSADNTYCSITRTNSAQNTYTQYGYLYINSSPYYIRDYPYVLVGESISYYETLGQWYTQPNYITYGCNWNFCNRPDLLSYLPTSFQMRLSEAWLNSSILGTGQPVQDCHQCLDGPVCSNNSFIDGVQCPTDSCNTTCLVSDLFNDPTSTQQCYESYCAPTDDGDSIIDTHRVDIEGILYASSPENVEVSQINIYCRADNCSRPEIFKELRDNLTLHTGDLTLLFNKTAEEPKIRCYDCYCESEQDCECDIVSTANALSTYCTITRISDGNNANVYFEHLAINSSYLHVRERPYVVVKESIIYGNETGGWSTRTDEVIYGCDWDYCNKPSLLSLLPLSFQMSLPESWLNTTILGTGQPIHYCHQCTNGAICSSNDTIDGSLCPNQPCNTTCLGFEISSDLTTNEQCYNSYCVPDNFEDIIYDPHRIEITGIVYASQPTVVDFWEISIYCQADNCSRPETFQEIKDNLDVEIGNLSTLFTQSSINDPDQLRCYDCYCIGDPVCACNKTAAQPIGESYCTIIREYDGQDVWIILEHIDRNSSRVYISEFPYMLVDESILYNEATNQWNTVPTLIVYGCNTDYCNDPRLIPRLPVSFQMRLSESWLNSNVLGTGQPARDCHECPDSPQCGTTDFLDASRCNIKSCNTTCFVADTFDIPGTNELCYQSYCLSDDVDDISANRHRVEIEGIIYGNRPSAQLEFWEIDIYCRADDCSRPEIFNELKADLTVDLGDLSAFFNITTTPLYCYDCYCIGDPVCACNKTAAQPIGESYCTIIREYDGQDVWIILEHIDRNSSRVYISEFPYMLVDESILYNETTNQWRTEPTLIVYGCNTDYCNDPRLIPHLPVSFQMRLSESWLNSNVLGTGQPVRDCHECPDSPQCGTTDFLDASRCNIKSCNTTCFVADTFDIPGTNELCYQSYCLSDDVDDISANRHRVEIEGIIYGNRPNAQLEFWEIDIYCRADDCSRPEIFNELKANLTVDLGDLSAFFNITTVSTTTTTTTTSGPPTISCYDCYCYNDTNCACNTYTTADASTSYCTIIRQNYDIGFFIALEHIDRNSTAIYVREFPYLLVEESIIYDESIARWNTITNFIVYGCNTNFCNHPSLVPYLPDSFQMRLGETWLNTNVLGTGQPVRNCHECPNAPVCSTTGFIDGDACPIADCNTTCLVSDVYDNPANNEQCYQSFCAPPDSPLFQIDPHRVEMQGILYLCPKGRAVELWEVDIFCRADDCSRPTIFDEVRNQFTVALGDLTIFYNISAATCVTTTTLSTSGSTTVSSIGTTQSSGMTTTTSAGASIYMTHIILILFFLLITLFNLY